MTLTLPVPPEKEAVLRAHAESRGLTVEEWFLPLADRSAPLESSEPIGRYSRPIWEIIIEDMKDVPREDLIALPKDGASQIDHYIYGTPKRYE